MPTTRNMTRDKRSKTKSRKTVGEQIAAANKIKKNIRATVRRKKVKKKRKVPQRRPKKKNKL